MKKCKKIIKPISLSDLAASPLFNCFVPARKGYWVKHHADLPTHDLNSYIGVSDTQIVPETFSLGLLPCPVAVGDRGTIIKLHTDALKKSEPIVAKPCCDAGGYLMFGNYKNYGLSSPRIHKLVYTAHKGPVPDGLELDHIDGNTSNPCLENLEAVTHAENIRRGLARGTTKDPIVWLDSDFAIIFEKSGKDRNIRVVHPSQLCKLVKSTNLSHIYRGDRVTANGFFVFIDATLSKIESTLRRRKVYSDDLFAAIANLEVYANETA